MQATFSSFRAFSNHRSSSERLVVVADDPAEGLQIDLESEGRRASVSFSPDEALRLARVLGAMLARRRHGDPEPVERFEGDDGDMLVVTRTNWGEPYDEGAQFSIRGANSLAVGMPNSELFHIRRTLDEVTSQINAEATPRGPGR